jgi:foldase protein PrsA
MIDTSIEGMVTAPSTSTPSRLMKNTKLLYTIVALLALSALLIANKQWVVAGVVNGKPIWSWQLNKIMTDRFGKQTLEGIISEQLIADEAKKQGVVVGKADVDNKQAEILKTLGANVSVDELLKYQGITRNDFDNQIRLQLTVQKILGKDVAITEGDVDSYVEKNRATLTATEPATLREEAKQAILDAKVGEKLQSWFQELKNKAKIVRFL